MRVLSDEYRKKHREREAARYWEKHKDDTRVCTVCGIAYLKIDRRGTTKTCSVACAAELKRANDFRNSHTEKARATQSKYRLERSTTKAEYARGYRKTTAGKEAQQRADKKRDKEILRKRYKARRYLRAQIDFSRGCSSCGAMVDLTIDHKIPISLGGDNCLGNLDVLCRRCNSKKATSIPHQGKEDFL